ncbi:MAG: PEP-CTERM sorting domain-containing protein, partial [Armatimonadota bacterium]
SPGSGIPVGNQLEIQLWSYAPQVAWDNISLDATTVPEPGALLCIVTGLLGLVGRCVRRK